ncbi:hypothetical protein T492DRAFT_615948, partial [Pavlovales sp. CCMP2436]
MTQVPEPEPALSAHAVAAQLSALHSRSDALQGQLLRTQGELHNTLAQLETERNNERARKGAGEKAGWRGEGGHGSLFGEGYADGHGGGFAGQADGAALASPSSDEGENVFARLASHPPPGGGRGRRGAYDGGHDGRGRPGARVERGAAARLLANGGARSFAPPDAATQERTARAARAVAVDEALCSPARLKAQATRGPARLTGAERARALRVLQEWFSRSPAGGGADVRALLAVADAHYCAAALGRWAQRVGAGLRAVQMSRQVGGRRAFSDPLIRARSPRRYARERGLGAWRRATGRARAAGTLGDEAASYWRELALRRGLASLLKHATRKAAGEKLSARAWRAEHDGWKLAQASTLRSWGIARPPRSERLLSSGARVPQPPPPLPPARIAAGIGRAGRKPAVSKADASWRVARPPSSPVTGTTAGTLHSPSHSPKQAAAVLATPPSSTRARVSGGADGGNGRGRAVRGSSRAVAPECEAGFTSRSLPSGRIGVSAQSQAGVAWGLASPPHTLASARLEELAQPKARRSVAAVRNGMAASAARLAGSGSGAGGRPVVAAGDAQRRTWPEEPLVAFATPRPYDGENEAGAPRWAQQMARSPAACSQRERAVLVSSPSGLRAAPAAGGARSPAARRVAESHRASVSAPTHGKPRAGVEVRPGQHRPSDDLRVDSSAAAGAMRAASARVAPQQSLKQCQPPGQSPRPALRALSPSAAQRPRAPPTPTSPQTPPPPPSRAYAPGAHSHSHRPVATAGVHLPATPRPQQGQTWTGGGAPLSAERRPRLPAAASASAPAGNEARRDRMVLEVSPGGGVARTLARVPACAAAAAVKALSTASRAGPRQPPRAEGGTAGVHSPARSLRPAACDAPYSASRAATQPTPRAQPQQQRGGKGGYRRF